MSVCHYRYLLMVVPCLIALFESFAPSLFESFTVPCTLFSAVHTRPHGLFITIVHIFLYRLAVFFSFTLIHTHVIQANSVLGGFGEVGNMIEIAPKTKIV